MTWKVLQCHQRPSLYRTSSGSFCGGDPDSACWEPRSSIFGAPPPSGSSFCSAPSPLHHAHHPDPQSQTKPISPSRLYASGGVSYLFQLEYNALYHRLKQQERGVFSSAGAFSALLSSGFSCLLALYPKLTPFALAS